jgi:hypothetical protein
MADPYAKYGGKSTSSPNDPYAKYGGTTVSGQGDPNETGIVGPDQTAPNAGLAPPSGANKNIVPARSVGTLGTNYFDENFNPVTEENKPKTPSFGEKLYSGTLGHVEKGLESLGGGADPFGDQPLKTPQPVKAANEFTKAGVNWSLPLLPTAVASAPIRTGLTLAAAYGGAKLGEKGSSLVTQDPDIQELASNLGGLAAGGFAAHKLFPSPPSGPTGNQNKAFNSLHPENASNTLHGGESVLPEILQEATNSFSKNSLLSGRPVVKVPKGEEGVRLLSDISQKAIDTHDAAVHAVADRFNGEKVDLTPAAQAALQQITPEMLDAAKTNPGTQRVIDSIKTIAQENSGEMTMKDAFDRKHRYNDNLSAELNKSAAAQDVSPQATQALRNAASGLRDAYYQRLSDLSGQDVRPLAQKEGALIEAKAGLDKSGTSAVKGQANDTGASPRLSQLNKAAQRVQLTRPASVARALPEMLQAIINPEANTPVGKYVKKTKRVLSSLPDRTSGPQATNIPRGNFPQLGQGAIVTPPLADTSGSMEFTPPPFDYTSRSQRLGVTPPSGGGTFEHSPYINQADSVVLPNQQGRVVPKQLSGAGPQGQPLLPEKTGGSIGLPEKSQTTLQKGRQFEVPRAADEGAMPALIRSFIEGEPTKGSGPVGSASSAPSKEVVGEDRNAGLKARKGGSLIPERGKGFVTNEAAERRALPRSTQAQLLTSELNEIRRSINESTTPEEKKYNEQRFIMKQEEVNKLGLPPELNNAIQASPKAKGVGK